MGLTYTKELREFDSLLTLLEPEVRKVFLENGIPLDFRDYDYSRHLYPEKAVPYRLDSKILERASWLAYDLGICDAPLLIEVEEDGRFLVNGEIGTLRELIRPLRVKDPYFLIHVIPAPELSCGTLFELFDSLHYSCETQRVSFSDRLSLPLMWDNPSNMYYYPAMDNIGRMTVIEVSGNNKIRFNEETVDLNSVDKDSFFATAAKSSHDQVLVISANDSIKCGEYIKVGLCARRAWYRIFFIREGHLPEGTPKM